MLTSASRSADDACLDSLIHLVAVLRRSATTYIIYRRTYQLCRFYFWPTRQLAAPAFCCCPVLKVVVAMNHCDSGKIAAAATAVWLQRQSSRRRSVPMRE